jgi:hypothetical protein
MRGLERGCWEIWGFKKGSSVFSNLCPRLARKGRACLPVLLRDCCRPMTSTLEQLHLLSLGCLLLLPPGKSECGKVQNQTTCLLPRSVPQDTFNWGRALAKTTNYQKGKDTAKDEAGKRVAAGLWVTPVCHPLLDACHAAASFLSNKTRLQALQSGTGGKLSPHFCLLQNSAVPAGDKGQRQYLDN